VPVITAIASFSCFVDRDTLVDINPSFELDTNIVPTPPHEPTFCNCAEAVERDEEVYRNKPQPMCMHFGVCTVNAMGNNGQFSSFKKQQAIGGMFDHVQSNRCVAALALVLSRTTCLIGAERIAQQSP
jgi:hypothetical protein